MSPFHDLFVAFALPDWGKNVQIIRRFSGIRSLDLSGSLDIFIHTPITQSSPTSFEFCLREKISKSFPLRPLLTSRAFIHIHQRLHRSSPGVLLVHQ